mmetsp:Transcript_22415/g.55455  ORF Transcript_22415/g.55455 Transcript_22415/m.55455 type:complete len:202 (+) Transcript_22415:677-1282(+)
METGALCSRRGSRVRCGVSEGGVRCRRFRAGDAKLHGREGSQRGVGGGGPWRSPVGGCAAPGAGSGGSGGVGGGRKRRKGKRRWRRRRGRWRWQPQWRGEAGRPSRIGGGNTAAPARGAFCAGGRHRQRRASGCRGCGRGGSGSRLRRRIRLRRVARGAGRASGCSRGGRGRACTKWRYISSSSSQDGFHHLCGSRRAAGR